MESLSDAGTLEWNTCSCTIDYTSGGTMNELKKILAVVDPTVAYQPAARRAAWLAKGCGAELERLVCYYNEYLSGDRLFDSPSLEKARDEVIENHEKHLETLAERSAVHLNGVDERLDEAFGRIGERFDKLELAAANVDKRLVDFVRNR